ncbi:hypothetical protein [Actinokineospora terrae]|uniref:HEAT repeat-containing protein n=1 Tax=Actinokineospora terrae TaxID=155974 RepID=A0A1H9KQ10_9PSEU|nr:hypothetical protein [Actinokineospora terrae]SER01168.1 hypothetical protein SAMN04487818_101277 [Actinokineospora terrae]
MARRLAFVLEIDPEVFAEHARDNGWDEAGADEEDEDRPRQRWDAPGGRVTFVDDTVVEVQYLDIEAEPSGPVEDAVKAEFTAYDKADCLGALDLAQPRETVVRALRLLACTAPGPVDNQVVEATTAALDDEREDVRVAALKVANYTRWTRLLPRVREVAESDGSDRVRRFAGNSRLLLEAVERA